MSSTGLPITTSAKSRISELPYDIRCHIVSFLPLKEAGRTSLLSKTWKHVWAYIGTLNFRSKPVMCEVEVSEYLNWVDQVISSYKAPVIDEFRVRIDFIALDNYTDKIDNWLRFAMEKRVKRLEMDFLCIPWGCFTFPKCLSCTSLTSLGLCNVDVTGEILESFLRNCLALEYMRVMFSESLVELTVAGPLLKLKSLIIKCCNSLRKLEISAPNLVYFSYCGGEKPDVQFKNTPKLARVFIDGKKADNLISCFSDLSSCLSQIEALTLSPFCSLYNVILPPEDLVLPRLVKLKVVARVIMDDDMFFYGSMMKACPSLLHFTLQLCVSKESRGTGNKGLRPKPFLHNHLKTVNINGFRGEPIDTEIAVFLIETALTLEKVTVDTFKSYDVGMQIEARTRAEKIRPHLKTGTKLEIL